MGRWSRNHSSKQMWPMKDPRLCCLSLYLLIICGLLIKQLRYATGNMVALFEAVSAKMPPPTTEQMRLLRNSFQDNTATGTQAVNASKASFSLHHQQSSSTADLLDQHFREGGLLLRVPDEGSSYVDDFADGQDFIPASYAHAGMRAPNLLYQERRAIRPKQLPFVALAYATKYDVNYNDGDESNDDSRGPNNDAPEGLASCRAYFPSDAWSAHRTHKLVKDPLGTSCTEDQINDETYFCNLRNNETGETEPCLYQVSQACQCGAKGRELLGIIQEYRRVRNALTPANDRLVNLPSFLPQVHGCWYPATRDGLHQIVEASNEFWFHFEFPDRPRKTPKKGKTMERMSINAYKGWTECSATIEPINKDLASSEEWNPGNLTLLNDVADAIVVHVPLRYTNKLGDIAPIELPDLEKSKLAFLEDRLQDVAHLRDKLPVVILHQTIGTPNEKECSLLWQGHDCENGFYKKFITPDSILLPGGSCLARKLDAEDDDKDVYWLLKDSMQCKGLSKHTEKLD